MNIEELLTKSITNDINHEILINLFKEAGVDEESIKKASDRFWERAEAKMNRNLTNGLKNEDIHKPNPFL